MQLSRCLALVCALVSVGAQAAPYAYKAFVPGMTGATAGPVSSCTTPWGTTVQNGESVPAYASATVPYGSACTQETRTCSNGSLSGSNTAASCSVLPEPLITLVSASYFAYNGGTLLSCDAAPKVSALVNGKASYTLNISSWSVVCSVDPWSGHQKTFEAYYTCAGQPGTKFLTFLGGTSGTFSCP